MQIRKLNQYNPNYTARCVEIRDAQWVIQTVNKAFQHVSTTRLVPAFKKFAYSEPDYIPPNTQLDSMKRIYQALCFIRDKFLMEKLKFYPKQEDYKKYKQTLAYIKNIRQLSYNRIKCKYDEKKKFQSIFNVIRMLSETKSGNCYEEASAAELILLMNGIPNACTATLESRFLGEISHNVCVFNRDGSRYNGVINRDTIVNDPWVQKVDFGFNMLKYYRNMCKDYFDIPTDRVLDITPIGKIELPEQEIEQFRINYPQLVFPNKNRKFMQKNKLP